MPSNIISTPAKVWSRRFSTTGWSRWIGTASTCSKPPKRDGLLESPRTIADIIFVPQLEVISELGDFSYANFLCQYLLRDSDAEFGRFAGNLPEGLTRVLVLLRSKLDFLSDGAAQRRLITACFMFLNLLAVYTRDLESGRANEAFPDALEDTMRQIVAALFLPIFAD